MCDAACRAKIILNGARVSREIEAAKELSAHLNLTEEEGYQLISILDEAEDKLIEFNNKTLAKTGYKRRTPKHHLEDSVDEI